MSEKNPIREAAERLNLWRECLGGSGNPYADKQYNLDDDLMLVCDSIEELFVFADKVNSDRPIKEQHFVVELVDDKVLAVHETSSFAEAYRLGAELAVQNGCEDEHHAEDCLVNEYLFYINNYSIQIKNNS